MSLPARATNHAAYQRPSHLSQEYWARLSDHDRDLYRLIRPRPMTQRAADIQLSGLEDFLSSNERNVVEMGGKFELMPDFQRGHVWSDAQQVSFMESLLRGAAKADLVFNCPGWVGDTAGGDIPEHTMQCVDGLQRLTAMRRYLRDEVRVFGGLRCKDLQGTPFRSSAYRVHFEIHEISSRAELLQFYLDMNLAGVRHTAEEGLRVGGLLAAALAPAPRPPPPVDPIQQPVKSVRRPW